MTHVTRDPESTRKSAASHTTTVNKSAPTSTPLSSRTWQRRSLGTNGVATRASGRQPRVLTDHRAISATWNSRIHYGRTYTVGPKPSKHRLGPSKPATKAVPSATSAWRMRFTGPLTLQATLSNKSRLWAWRGWLRSPGGLTMTSRSACCMMQRCSLPSTRRTIASSHPEKLAQILLQWPARSITLQVRWCSCLVNSGIALARKAGTWDWQRHQLKSKV